MKCNEMHCSALQCNAAGPGWVQCVQRATSPGSPARSPDATRVARPRLPWWTDVGSERGRSPKGRNASVQSRRAGGVTVWQTGRMEFIAALGSRRGHFPPANETLGAAAVSAPVWQCYSVCSLQVTPGQGVTEFVPEKSNIAIWQCDSRVRVSRLSDIVRSGMVQSSPSEMVPQNGQNRNRKGKQDNQLR